MQQYHPIVQLHERMKSCIKRECPLHPVHGNAMQIVPGDGNFDAKIVFIGEAPGADEDRNGQPFVGDAGEMLNKVIAEIGLTRTDIYITNICKCRPQGNRTPIMIEMDYCDGWLSAELTQIKPKVIVTLGNTPKDRLVPAMPGIKSCHGWIKERWIQDNTIKSKPLDYLMTPDNLLDEEPLDMRKIVYLFTYHPSYVKRMGGYGSKTYDEMVMDIEKLIDIAYDHMAGWRK
jgi:uracil-DNA glycosylase family 4